MQRELLLLDEIIEASRRAIDIAGRHSPSSLQGNFDARDALLWNMTVVGEAVAQLPEEVRESHPEIPWSHPMRLRNQIVHGYWSVELDLIHSVAMRDLPGFAVQVQEVLRRLEGAS